MSTPFLTNQLGSSARLIVEIAWGADLTVDASNWTWTDITSDVRQVNGQGIGIRIGRPDEFSQAPPATCTFELKNQTGAYTPFNPASSNYPNVREGTPVRVQVTINGITKYTRFFGYANGFSPGWDAEGKAAYVTVSASGSLRRLQQNTKPLRSALYRKLTSTATVPANSALPDAYWPLEEGGRATLAATPSAGAQPLSVVGNFAFAANNDAPGAGPQPDFRSGGGRLTGTIPGSGATTSWRVQFPLKADAAMVSTDIIPVAQFVTSAGQIWEIVLNGALGIDVALAELGSGTTFHWGAPVSDGFWHEVRVTATYSAPNTTIVIAVDGDSQVGSSTASTLVRLGTVEVNPANPISSPSLASPISVGVGHIQIWNSVPSVALDTVAATHGYAPFTPVPFGTPTILTETTTDRISRLMLEEGGLGLPLSQAGTATTVMGPQGVDTFLNLLREGETTEVGLLHDGLTQGLTFVCRSNFYNQSAALTIDATAGQVPTSPAITPTHDDLLCRNRVTVTNKNGTEVTAEEPAGPLGTAAVGVYEASAQVNLVADGSALNQAGWRVHLGTVDGFRYPSLYLDLAAAPELATSWLATTPSERIDLTNLSNRLTQHPTGTVSQILEGYSETLTSKTWRVSANCSPAQPWNVGTLNGTFRLEMAGQTLASNLAAGATSLSLATASGHQLFTTSAAYPADFPMDLNDAGWQIHVTAASGSSSPQPLTITASPNTSTISSGTAVTLQQPSALAL